MQHVRSALNPLTRPIVMIAFVAALSAAMVTSLTPSPAAARSGLTFEPGDRVEVIADALNARAEPSLDAEVVFVATARMLGTVNEGPVEADEHFWYEVTFDTGSHGYHGWVSGGYLTTADGGDVEPPPPSPEPYTLVILALNCESDPGTVGMEPFPPAGCEMAGGGIGFTVADTDGVVLDGCTSDNSGACFTAVPYGATVLVSEDDATTPAGYAPREDPVTVQVPAEEPAGEAPRATFVNIRQATDPGDGDGDEVGQIDQLPNTGTGAAAAANAGRLGAFLPLAVLTALTGGTVYGLRQRVRE